VRLRGRLWIRLLLVLAAVRLYRALRAVLVALHIPADLLVECGDHDGGLVFRDLPWVTHGQVRRPRSTDD
jgi:hypothetical protein